MKTYYFTSNGKEYKILAKSIKSAVVKLSQLLVSSNEIFHVDPYYYCESAENIPRDLYEKYLTGYSF